MSEHIMYKCNRCGYSYVAVVFNPTNVRERFCEMCERNGDGQVLMSKMEVN